MDDYGPLRNDGPLFTTPQDSGPRTSVEAARSVETTGPAQRTAVLAVLRLAGSLGATREELEGMTGLSGNAVRPRVAELLAARLVTDGPDCRLTRSGRRAWVVRAVRP